MGIINRIRDFYNLVYYFVDERIGQDKRPAKKVPEEPEIKEADKTV